MLETVKTLCRLSGVSGFEDEVRDYILTRALPYADGVETDAMGNLVIFKRGAVTPAKKVMLCAHMDEVGLIVTGIDEDGYLKFGFVGGVDRRVVLGRTVFLGPGRVPGVIGVKAYHLVSKEEEKTVPKTDELYIDIGAENRAQAEKLVSLGDYGVFEYTVTEFGASFLKAKAIDDRLGCAAQLKLIESDLPCDCHFAFTVQEEVGTRGAKTAAYAVQPEVCLVLEGTTAADIPGSTAANEVCRLDGGVVIPFMDKGTIYDPGLYKGLTALAEEKGVKWQTKRMIAGGTDAGAIQRSLGGVRTAGLACALRNIHSPACVANTADFEPMRRLAYYFLEKVAEDQL